MRVLLFVTVTIFAMVTTSVRTVNAAEDPATQTQTSSAADYEIQTVAEGLDFPWSIAFLPNGDYLVALRVGEGVA